MTWWKESRSFISSALAMHKKGERLLDEKQEIPVW